MSPQRLTRLSITLTVVLLSALLLVWFFEHDAPATRYCLDQGYSEGECGWR